MNELSSQEILCVSGGHLWTHCASKEPESAEWDSAVLMGLSLLTGAVAGGFLGIVLDVPFKGVFIGGTSSSFAMLYFMKVLEVWQPLP